MLPNDGFSFLHLNSGHAQSVNLPLCKTQIHGLRSFLPSIQVIGLFILHEIHHFHNQHGIIRNPKA
jgi:hypothetical protein